MKKKLIMLLIFVMAFGFASCGNSGGDDKEKKADSNYKTVTVDNKFDHKITVEYPKDFKESSDDFYGSTHLDFRSKKIVGDDYVFGLGFGKPTSTFKTIDKYLSIYKNGNIQETKEIDGHKATIHQSYNSSLIIIIPYSGNKYATLEFSLNSAKDESDFRKVEEAYKKLYEDKEVQKIIESIKIEEFKPEGNKEIDKNYFSITPTGDWFMTKEENDRVYFENRSGDITKSLYLYHYNFKMKQFIDSRKKAGYVVTDKKIGDTKYKMLTKNKGLDFYLLTPSKKDKGDSFVCIDIFNAKLDEATDLLKTIKIK